MPNKEKIVEDIENLIVKYKSKDEKTRKDLSEANVRKDFIDPLFEVLNWDVRNSDEYDAESYVRGVGFADVAIKVEGKPKMFIEAKKFGGVPSRQDRSVQTTLKGQKIYADWTEEERQVLNYAGATVGVKWAILTNFEKLRLFNAKTGETVLNIEKLDQYLEKIDDILLLTKENVLNGNINKLEERVERPDVDMHFLNLIKKWQLILANEIYNSNHSLSLEELNLYVQRILDRLVIVRFAEDNWILNNPDQLKTIRDSALKSDYVSLTDMLINFFNGFDDEHDSKIFEKNEKINEMIRDVDDKVFNDLISELYDQSFRKFTSDILGNTYENYLSSKLELKDGKIILHYMNQSKKDQGIYYTPPYIVDYIVQNTLGNKLESLWEEVLKLFNKREYKNAVLKFKEIYDIKVLDPSCGSGSFLIKAHDTFIKCYKKYETEIKKAKKELKDQVTNNKINSWEFTNLTQLMNEPLKNFERRILKKNIYGVDLDENAAEIASINLMLRALKPHEKLPLILYENVKVGNSLITGVDDADELKGHSDEIKELIEYRKKIKNTQDLKEKEKLEKELNKLKTEINDKLNENLFDYFKKLNEIKPFNWEIEFPEVFYDQNGKLKDNKGFDIVIGNPPYVQMQKMPIEFRNYVKFGFKETYASQNDLWYYFSKNGSSLLNNGGLLGFITSRYFMEATHAKKTRKFLLNNNRFINLIDFGSIPIFKGVGTHTTIFIFEKQASIDENNLIKIVKVKKWTQDNELLINHITEHLDNDEYNDEFIEIFFKDQSRLDENNWVLTNDKADEIFKKINEKKSKLIDICEISNGIKSGFNPAFEIDKKTIIENKLEMPLLRPLIKNSDIKRYYVKLNDKYLIYTTENTKIEDYPNIKSYLTKFKNELKEKQELRGENSKWFELYRPREFIFDKSIKKIICPYRSNKNNFTYDNKGLCGSTDIYAIKLRDDKSQFDLKYLLSILNSKLFLYYYLSEGKKKGDILEFGTEPLSKIPIPEIDPKKQEPFIGLVDKIMNLNKQKSDLINSFVNLVRISKQSSMFKPLKYFLNLKNAADYKINLIKTEILIDETKEAKPRSYKVYEGINCLYINVTYADDSNEDVLKIHFDDPVLKEFFYLAVSVGNNGRTKAYRVNKNVLNTLLNDIKIPKYTNNKKNDVENIRLLMDTLEREYTNIIKDKYKDSPIQGLGLDLLNRNINEVDAEINKRVYELYDMHDEEIRTIEDSLNN